MSLAVLGWVRRAAHIRLVLGALAVLEVSPQASAANVTLAWDPSANAAGYNVYYGVGSRTYAATVPAGNNTSVSVSNLVAGTTYYFAATTYNIAGLESDYSSEIAYTVPGGTISSQPPALNPISDVLMPENSGPQTVNLSGISAGITNFSSITVSAFSSNPGLIPNPVVNYTSPNSTGSLTLSPAANSYGTVVITVMVDNGAAVSNTVIRTFGATVVPVNNPPTLDPLANVAVGQNAGPQMVSLTGISSGDAEVQTLTVTAVSANPAVVPNPTVNYSNPNAAGTLTFTPASGASGSALITVTVNDNQPTNNLTSRAFTVTVNQGTVTAFTDTVQPTSWTMTWQSTSGYLSQWEMNGTNMVRASLLHPANVGRLWKIAATADLNGDGQDELLFQHPAGTLSAWFMEGTNFVGGGNLSPASIPANWQIMAAGSLLGGTQKDLILEDTNGWVKVWSMSGTNRITEFASNPAKVSPGWRIAGFGDLEGDGHKQVLLQHKAGWIGAWTMEGTNATEFSYLNPAVITPGWSIVGTRDFNGDGRTDLILQHKSGWVGVWLMNGTNAAAFHFFNPPKVDTAWKIVGPK